MACQQISTPHGHPNSVGFRKPEEMYSTDVMQRFLNSLSNPLPAGTSHSELNDYQQRVLTSMLHMGTRARNMAGEIGGHGDSLGTNGTFQCDCCREKFGDRRQLFAHRHLTHRVALHCATCPSTMTSMSEMNRHHLVKHRRTTATWPSAKRSKSVPPGDFGGCQSVVDEDLLPETCDRPQSAMQWYPPHCEPTSNPITHNPLQSNPLQVSQIPSENEQQSHQQKAQLALATLLRHAALAQKQFSNENGPSVDGEHEAKVEQGAGADGQPLDLRRAGGSRSSAASSTMCSPAAQNGAKTEQGNGAGASGVGVGVAQAMAPFWHLQKTGTQSQAGTHLPGLADTAATALRHNSANSHSEQANMLAASAAQNSTPTSTMTSRPQISSGNAPDAMTIAAVLASDNEDDWEALMEIDQIDEMAKIRQIVGEKGLPPPEDPNQCLLCRRILSCKSALQMHYRTHTGERPFRCKICHRAFTTKGNLKTHMGVHRAKHPFSGMSNQVPNMMMTTFVSGCRPLHQALSGAAGNPTGALNQHQCAICQKRFFSQPMLQQHMHMHAQQLRSNGMAGLTSTTNTSCPLPPGMDTPTSNSMNRFPFPLPFNPGLLNPGLNRFHPAHGGPPGGSLGAPPGVGGGAAALFAALMAVKGASPLSPNLLPNLSHLPHGGRPGGTPTTSIGSPAAFGPVPSASDLPPVALLHHLAAAAAAQQQIQLRGATADRNLEGLQGQREGGKRESELHHPLSAGETHCATPLHNDTSSPAAPVMDNQNSSSNLTDQVTQSGHLTHSNSDNNNVSEGSFDADAALQTKCTLCCKVFACNSALEIHYRSHTQERPFICMLCPRSFSTKGNLKQHMLTHKSGKTDGSLSDRDVLDDQTSQSCGPPSRDDDIDVECAATRNEWKRASSECAGTFSANLNSADFPESCHDSASTSVRPDLDECQPPTKAAKFDAMQLVTKPGDADFVSPVAPGPSPLESIEKMWAITEKQQQEASAEPRTKPVLAKHQCAVCFKHFSSSSALQIHMRTHTGDKPFKCNVCQRAFTTKGNLKVHMGTHSTWSQQHSAIPAPFLAQAPGSLAPPQAPPARPPSNQHGTNINSNTLKRPTTLDQVVMGLVANANCQQNSLNGTGNVPEGRRQSVEPPVAIDDPTTPPSPSQPQNESISTTTSSDTPINNNSLPLSSPQAAGTVPTSGAFGGDSGNVPMMSSPNPYMNMLAAASLVAASRAAVQNRPPLASPPLNPLSNLPTTFPLPPMNPFPLPTSPVASLPNASTNNQSGANSTMDSFMSAMLLWRTVCSVCGKVCPSGAELERHLRVEHLAPGVTGGGVGVRG